MTERDKKIKAIQEDYEYGFGTDAEIIFDTGKGLNEDVIRAISKAKNEPEWMLEYRLESYKYFKEKTNPKWGPDLSGINFDEFTYFVRNIDGVKNTWDEVPEEIKMTFERLGIPQAEREYLAGVSTQFESEVVYHSTQAELDEAGIIYIDTDTALKKYPEIFKKYFGTVVPNYDNKYAALNGAVWSGGSFIYVPKGAKISKPIQSYFRMNSNQLGQFERTLIIVEEGAEINYIEGCTAPTYSKDSLHAAVVEVIVHKDAKCRYTTIQNWSSNVLNLVTKRAHVFRNGLMEWIDGNMGSSLNMKYPACLLLEPYAKGNMISIAVAGKNQNQDAGAKMIHLAPNTSSNIISKSISHSGGIVNYRGKVFIAEDAIHSKSHIECDTIILDKDSYSDTIPVNIVHNSESTIEHEATVSKISEDQLFYLMSRGLTEEQATEMILMGFIEPFARELPMEYAVELNHLIKMEMEGSIG
ncbi:MAG: Fe-S cluster assembly protein SufB [Acholeplasmataceae bacterium]|nr:Fe-S cluster assembly protein SufB [Acholeplasmataceae bacterium]